MNQRDEQTCIELPEYERNILLYILDKIMSSMSLRELEKAGYQFISTIQGTESLIQNDIVIIILAVSVIISGLSTLSNVQNIIVQASASITVILCSAVIIYEVKRTKELSDSKQELFRIVRTEIEEPKNTIKQLTPLFNGIIKKYDLSRLCSPDKELVDHINGLVLHKDLLTEPINEDR